jgi:hypothetical protein
MSTPKIQTQIPSATQVYVSENMLTVDLSDGRSISVPLGWYPRLLHGNAIERNNWRLTAGGRGIHWTDLDEDISVENLLAGKPSGESQTSLKNWLTQRFLGTITRYRKRRDAATWHFVETCSTWPGSDYEEQSVKPVTGVLCQECLAKITSN